MEDSSVPGMRALVVVPEDRMVGLEAWAMWMETIPTPPTEASASAGVVQEETGIPPGVVVDTREVDRARAMADTELPEEGEVEATSIPGQ